MYMAVGTKMIHSETVLGSANTLVTLTGLLPATLYSIKVAAVNNAGTGHYSEISATTKG